MTSSLAGKELMMLPSSLVGCKVSPTSFSMTGTVEVDYDLPCFFRPIGLGTCDDSDIVISNKILDGFPV